MIEGLWQNNNISKGLFWACECGHLNLVKWLVEKGADINYYQKGIFMKFLLLALFYIMYISTKPDIFSCVKYKKEIFSTKPPQKLLVFSCSS